MQEFGKAITQALKNVRNRINQPDLVVGYYQASFMDMAPCYYLARQSRFLGIVIPFTTKKSLVNIDDSPSGNIGLHIYEPGIDHIVKEELSNVGFNI